MIEVQAVQALVSSATNRTFELREQSRYPIPKERVKWFLSSNDMRAEASSPYLHVVWADIDDTIHMDTKPLGDTMDMIEWIYGEVPRKVIDIDYAEFGKKGEVWDEVRLRYPPVANRLLRYELVTERVSKAHGVPLEMLYHGGKGLAEFRVETRVKTGQTAALEVPGAIEAALSALKDVYYKIAQHQQRLADAWGYLPARPLYD